MTCFENIPEALRKIPHWCVTSFAKRENGDVDKMPRQLNGKPAKSTDPSTWCSFEEAAACAKKRNWHVTFCFTADLPYTAIDLDHVIGADGTNEPWVSPLIDYFATYTEHSASGTGWHLVVESKLPHGERKVGRVEVYDSAKFITLTGDTVLGFGSDEIRRVEITPAIHQRLMSADPDAKKPPKSVTTGNDSEDDWRLIGEVQREVRATRPEELDAAIALKYPSRHSDRNRVKGLHSGQPYFLYSCAHFLEKNPPSKGAIKMQTVQVTPACTLKRKELATELDALCALYEAGPTEETNQKITAVAQALKELVETPTPPTWRDVFHTGSELDQKPSKVFIKGILEEGITFFGALSGVGKTWIGLSIVHALLSGEPLFGTFPVLQKTNVLYLVPEMGGRKFRERLVKMRISMDGGFFCQTIKDGACDLDDPLLLQAVKDTQAVVILDTAIRFQAGDEQSSSQQAQGLGAKMFNLIAAGAQAIICMHHRSKDRKDKEPNLENTLRGTGDFGAMADCVWCVEHSRKKKSGDSWGFDGDHEEESKHLTRLTLTNVKPRDMEPAEPFTIQGRPYINEKGDFIVLDSDGGDDPAATKELPVSDARISLMVAAVKANPKISARELRKVSGFGLARVKKEMQECGYRQQSDVWVNKRSSEELFTGIVEGEPQ